jgi:hypothetical protein
VPLDDAIAPLDANDDAIAPLDASDASAFGRLDARPFWSAPGIGECRR